jgi:hypothetical protein
VTNSNISHEQDGPMKVYRREADENGEACDQLKATHVVQGVSAKVCHVSLFLGTASTNKMCTALLLVGTYSLLLRS